MRVAPTGSLQSQGTGELWHQTLSVKHKHFDWLLCAGYSFNWQLIQCLRLPNMLHGCSTDCFVSRWCTFQHIRDVSSNNQLLVSLSLKKQCTSKPVADRICPMRILNSQRHVDRQTLANTWSQLHAGLWRHGRVITWFFQTLKHMNFRFCQKSSIESHRRWDLWSCMFPLTADG